MGNYGLELLVLAITLYFYANIIYDFSTNAENIIKKNMFGVLTFFIVMMLTFGKISISNMITIFQRMIGAK